MSDDADDCEDKDELDEVEEEAEDVFCEKDVAQAERCEEVELDAGAVDAETVVGQDGDAEDGVGDGDGEEIGAEASAYSHAAGEEEDHEDGSDEAEELVGVAAKVEELLLEAGDDGWAETEGAGFGSVGLEGDGWRGCLGVGVSGCCGFLGGIELAEEFAVELAPHSPGVDGEEEGAEGDEADECGDGGQEMAVVEVDDGGGGESGWKCGCDWLKAMEELEQDGKVGGGVVVVVATALHAGIEGDVEILNAEGADENDCGEDLAGAAGGEPAVDPGKDHAGEDDVSESVDGKEKRGPREECGLGDPYADVGGDGGGGA